MDAFVLIMGTVFSVVIFSPVVYLLWAAKNMALKLKSEMMEVATKLNLKITDQENWNNKIIGLDKSHKVLLFISLGTGNKINQVVELLRTSKCQVLHDHQFIKLEITTRESIGVGRVSVVLFDANFDDPIEEGLHYEIAKKWAKQINEIIEIKKRPLKAA
jgi:hypothetical protein